MNLDAFIRERSGSWDELAELVRAARGRPQRLGPAGVRRLGAHYRAAAADLALARRRWPGDPLVGRLDDLVGRARHLVYAGEARRLSLRTFLGTGYWMRVRALSGPVLLAAALLAVPAVLVGIWTAGDPAAGAGFLPAPYRDAGDSPGGDLGWGVGTQAAMASQILTNNIQVSFLAFAAGITAGIGTALVLAYNGAILGGVAGLSVAGGNVGPLVELVAPHGVLELSIIAVSGAAGMTIGWALIDPGRVSRRAALATRARAGVEVVLGTMPWFVVAGLVEGFVTPTGLGAGPGLAVGLAVAAAYWALVLWRGRLALPVDESREARAVAAVAGR